MTSTNVAGHGLIYKCGWRESCCYFTHLQSHLLPSSALPRANASVLVIRLNLLVSDVASPVFAQEHTATFDGYVQGGGSVFAPGSTYRHQTQADRLTVVQRIRLQVLIWFTRRPFPKTSKPCIVVISTAIFFKHMYKLFAVQVAPQSQSIPPKSPEQGRSASWRVHVLPSLYSQLHPDAIPQQVAFYPDADCIL